MMDYSNPADWVFALALIQVFGLKYLMTASDGSHFGLVAVSAKGRWIALWVSVGIIWIPYLVLWATLGHSPADMWGGATAWWNSGLPIGYALAIVGWWLLLSPLQMIAAAALTARQQIKEGAAHHSPLYDS